MNIIIFGLAVFALDVWQDDLGNCKARVLSETFCIPQQIIVLMFSVCGLNTAGIKDNHCSLAYKRFRATSRIAAIGILSKSNDLF